MAPTSKKMNKIPSKKVIGKPAPQKSSTIKKDLLDVIDNFFLKRKKFV